MFETLLIFILIAVSGGLAFYAWQLRQQRAHQETQLARRVADKDERVTALQEQQTQKDAEIATLKGEMSELRSHCTESERQLNTLRHDTDYKLALTLTLANAAYDALIVVNEDFEVIATNTSAEQLFSIQAGVQGTLVDLTNLPELKMMVEDALTNQEASFEEQMIIHDRNYRVQAKVIKRSGHLFIGLALRDITQLVRLNRARRDMVANISHELRTPIANIRLIIDSLFHEQDKPKRKESITSLRQIAREADNLLWLVQEMSDLSMIESGQAIVRMVDEPLADLVDEAIEHMHDQSALKNINLVRHVPEKLAVLCDRDLAKRVLVNLIHNAIKWSPEGETITINASNGGEMVTISVLDNGPGVPEDAVDRIFERFYQVDASRSGGGGSGLGLAICRHIVEAHGGNIWAESNKDGSGGRFLFTLLSAGEHIVMEGEEVEAE